MKRFFLFAAAALICGSICCQTEAQTRSRKAARKAAQTTEQTTVQTTEQTAGQTAVKYAKRTDKILAEINNPDSKYVVVAVHRGDWRNYPENSIPAIESIIRMGADIMELDIKLTKDSVLVLMHDGSVNRCLTGKGKVSDFTLAELKAMRMVRGHGIATDSLRIPTLREALECCKDRICVNIDQGFNYYDMILKMTEELGMTDQILIKSSRPVASVAASMEAHPHNMMYMPVCNLDGESGRNLFNEYQSTGTVPLAYEICWSKLTPEVKEAFETIHKTDSKLWINTIWGSLCGYLDDDKALDCGDPALIYDQVMSFGPSFIQTDRPEQLLNYLRSKGLHD
jgi:glycerophosphoryl diester phosphodiesterase